VTRPAPGDALLAQARSLVAGCDRCGTCLPACPLFKVLDLERASARGKNAIARGLAEGGLEPGPGTRSAVEFCLLCRACTDICPNRVPTDEAMIRLRQAFAQAGRPAARYRLVGGFLGSRRWVRLGAWALGAVRRLRLGALAPAGWLPREASRAQYLAALAGPAILGAPVPAAPGPGLLPAGTRVGYFQGCGMRLLFPDAARSTLGLLARAGTATALDNPCCGLPHLAHGMEVAFLRLARANIAMGEGFDVVVTDCASCGSTLKHLGQRLEEDPLWRGRAAAFRAKLLVLCE